MRTLYKKTLIIVIVLSLSLGLVACHGERGIAKFEMPENFDENKTYTITFWAKNDNNKFQQQIYKNAVASFEATYPNINVNMRMFADYNEIYKNVITNIQTGTTPNVCITYPDHVATYNTGGEVVVSLDELIDDEKYGFGGSEIKFDAPAKDEIVPAYLAEGKIGDSVYTIPFMRSTEACYVNRDLVEKLGYELPEKLTWDFIWEVSEAALEKNPDGTYKANGQSVMIPFIYKSTDNMMIQMLAQREAGYSTNDGEIQIFNETTKEILYEISQYAESGAFSTFKISSYPGNYLNAGQCVFAIDSTAGATWMGSGAPNLDIDSENVVDFNMEVMALPQYNEESPKMISQGPSICVFNDSDPDTVLASWIFAQFLLTNEVQITYSQTEGYVPVTTKAQSSDEYREYLENAGKGEAEYLEYLNFVNSQESATDEQKKRLSELKSVADAYYKVKVAASKILIENQENTFITPVFNGSASLRNAAGQLIENVTKSKRRGETVDEPYMEKLFDDVFSLFRLDQISVGEGENNVAATKELGPLPTESVVLLSVLCGIWIIIGGCFGFSWWKRYKNQDKS